MRYRRQSVPNWQYPPYSIVYSTVQQSIVQYSRGLNCPTVTRNNDVPTPANILNCTVLNSITLHFTLLYSITLYLYVLLCSALQSVGFPRYLSALSPSLSHVYSVFSTMSFLHCLQYYVDYTLSTLYLFCLCRIDSATTVSFYQELTG